MPETPADIVHRLLQQLQFLSLGSFWVKGHLHLIEQNQIDRSDSQASYRRFACVVYFIKVKGSLEISWDTQLG